jgi:hypothetical protein
LADINRLLSGYPPGNWTDPEQALRSYLLAVDDYPAQDVEAAVVALIKGVAPGVNPGFLPPPAVVGAECKRQNNLRCEREARDKRLHPALPPPDVERTPESRARVKAMIDQTVANLAAKSLDDPVERHRRRIAKTNERFDANPYFEVGDPEDTADAA